MHKIYYYLKIIDAARVADPDLTFEEKNGSGSHLKGKKTGSNLQKTTV